MVPQRLCLALLAPMLQIGLGCTPPPGTTFACGIKRDVYPWVQLAAMVRRNCAKVNKSIAAYKNAMKSGEHEYFNPDQPKIWMQRNISATRLCKTALNLLDRNKTKEGTYTAACYAVNAWGSVMMDGSECCNLAGPPHCKNVHWQFSTVFLIVLFVAPVLMLGGTLFKSCFGDRGEKKDPLDGEPEYLTAQAPQKDIKRRCAPPDPQLAGHLEELWLSKSPLRVLPYAPILAKSTAGLMSAVQVVFDFQVDSVRNQCEHLLSLWRSHCATVADRAVEDCTTPNEKTLLVDALEDLHTELLEGFTRWRSKLAEHESAGIEDLGVGVPMLGGSDWRGVPVSLYQGEFNASRAAAENSEQLAEIAMYLLVWGEAGNVRFMPEVVYLITELALAAAPPGSRGMYGQPNLGPSQSGSQSGSALFLSEVIRPIYNVVFDACYDAVNVNPNNKDAKKLRAGLEAFLPADVPNYDDWNELFCNPKRLVEGLQLNNGEGLLFDLPHEKRFAALRRVDWKASLASDKTKTHREVHSIWGLYASTHRVWLVHALLFLVLVVFVTTDGVHNQVWPMDGTLSVPVGGMSPWARLAAVGLVVPISGAMWIFASWNVTGKATWDDKKGRMLLCWILQILIFLLPVFTYTLVWKYEHSQDASVIDFRPQVGPILIVHFVVSALGAFILLFAPMCGRDDDQIWTFTGRPLPLMLVRYLFWIFVLGLKSTMWLRVLLEVYSGFIDLGHIMPGRMSVMELNEVKFSTVFVTQFLGWFLMWSVAFILWLADTQLWFVIVSSILGMAVVAAQRKCRVCDCTTEDQISQIPERFSEKVLPYAVIDEVAAAGRRRTAFSAKFPYIWDRIVEYMRYEDKCDNPQKSDMSFGNVGGFITWNELTRPLISRMGVSKKSEEDDRLCSVRVPGLFNQTSFLERFSKRYLCIPDHNSVDNRDMMWRLDALARGLALPMPRPFRAPYIPGLTVIIPHYGESILLEKRDLFKEQGEITSLIDWVEQFYEDEFRYFTSRHQAARGINSFPAAGSQWNHYTEEQWEKLCGWASMRYQTLWRTVAGMCLYHPALQVLYEAQGDKHCALGSPEVWDPKDVFQCLVTMQIYPFFNKTQFAQTNQMFEKFPNCLKVAFIDYEAKGDLANMDNVHSNQDRRYFSCLIDGNCEMDAEGRRKAMYKIELPGFPILGDGKGDNQNHAVPFVRGAFTQAIDANQGAYFEQMLLLPSVLAEFRHEPGYDDGNKKIVGFPEHITSDIGSIGDFAASAEIAFGTILQRTYAILGARMHYGHPDIMNHQFMMQQGGISKATKTLNLSEDIFAGMDFTLRGFGRDIKHAEYFHLAKGRDLGFVAVLGFFSKLSSGAGEQIITRQMFRLGNLLSVPEAFTFWYAHVGYYFTQFLVSMGMPLIVVMWLVMIIMDCEHHYKAFFTCETRSEALTSVVVLANIISVWFSRFMLFFLFASMMPLMVELSYERGLKFSIGRAIKSIMTLSPLMFIFQAKCIGYYCTNELRYGGATYVATGRGLPTERIPFIGKPIPGKCQINPKSIGGLYLSYAHIAHYAGFQLLMGAFLLMVLGGTTVELAGNNTLVWMWVSLALTIVSWLFAPYVFNPYQFKHEHFLEDLRAWIGFYLGESSMHWVKWYETHQLKLRIPQRNFGNYVLNINIVLGIFFIMAWAATVNHKLHVLGKIYHDTHHYVLFLHVGSLCPPVALSILYCVWALTLELCCKCICKRRMRDASDSSEESKSSADESVPEQITFGIPLSVSAMVVFLLTLIESLLTLYPLLIVNWKNTFAAALILKFMWVQVLIFLGECLIRARWFQRRQCSCRAFQIWVRSQRLMEDIVVSWVILAGLAPFVLLNVLNEKLCGGCNLHSLLLYRDPGHQKREDAYVVDLSEDEAEVNPTQHNRRSLAVASHPYRKI